ncbi:hypothetical protein VTO42DRAFT_8864 [Malbranchea cinnamomea]
MYGSLSNIPHIALRSGLLCMELPPNVEIGALLGTVDETCFVRPHLRVFMQEIGPLRHPACPPYLPANDDCDWFGARSHVSA